MLLTGACRRQRVSVFVSTPVPPFPSPSSRLCSHSLIFVLQSFLRSRFCCLDSPSHTLTTTRSVPTLSIHLSPSLCGLYSSSSPIAQQKDLWSLLPLQPPTLLSSHMRKVRRKHRASDIPPSPRTNPSPIRLVSLQLYPLSLKSTQNPLHPSRSHSYLLLISLFLTHPLLAPRALTYHHTPRLVNQQHMT